jgi:hypothetical protein
VCTRTFNRSDKLLGISVYKNIQLFRTVECSCTHLYPAVYLNSWMFLYTLIPRSLSEWLNVLVHTYTQQFIWTVECSCTHLYPAVYLNSWMFLYTLIPSSLSEQLNVLVHTYTQKFIWTVECSCTHLYPAVYLNCWMFLYTLISVYKNIQPFR